MTILQEQLSRRTVEFFSLAHRLEQYEEDLYICARAGRKKGQVEAPRVRAGRLGVVWGCPGAAEAVAFPACVI